MDKPLKSNIRTEIREISDADCPPKHCPKCSGSNFIRKSYYIRELQDLGDPSVIRRVRYESVIWLCKDCGTTFTIKDDTIPYRSTYMPSVINYTTTRILKKGDSARRVTNDLHELHHVDVSLANVLSWVNDAGHRENIPLEFENKIDPSKFSGVLGVDGTFKAVKAKKNDLRGDENKQLLLHLTHLQDGRLVAYWQMEKMKKKSPHSSKN